MAETRNKSAVDPMKREIHLTRVLDAPSELVWKAWTDPKHLAKWWGPHGFTNPVCEIDLRPGGRLYIIMRSPDGVEYPMKGVFREIVEHERLVFTAVAEDTQGIPALESLTTVTFAKQGTKTMLTVEASAVGLAPIASQMLQGMEAGWTQTLERLADLVPQLPARGK